MMKAIVMTGTSVPMTDGARYVSFTSYSHGNTKYSKCI